jgi:hypothetical protein
MKKVDEYLSFGRKMSEKLQDRLFKFGLFVDED